MKRYAAHFLRLPDGSYIKMQVVEVVNGYVTKYFPFVEESENIEWLPGVIILIPEAITNRNIPYLDYPYDFIAMQPVDGTLRKRLL